MRKNLIPLLAIALVVAALSTAVFYGLIADRLEPAKSASANTRPAPTAMLVAARNIERGKLLESGDVRVSELNCPTGQNCVKDVSAALGRATLDPLVEGQTIPEGRTRREQLDLADRYREVTVAAYPWYGEELEGAADAVAD